MDWITYNNTERLKYRSLKHPHTVYTDNASSGYPIVTQDESRVYSGLLCFTYSLQEDFHAER